MPYYEYECVDCGSVVEIFQHMDDEPIETLKHNKMKPYSFELCEGRLEKKISIPSLRFIGPGFFINDYKGK